MSFLSLASQIDSQKKLKKRGDLSNCPFYVLFDRVVRQRLSGKLILEKGDRVKHVYFDKGNPTSIKSNLVSESLYSIIIRRNLLSKEKIASIIREIEALNFLENLDFEQKLYMYLKEKDYLTKDDLQKCLNFQFTERLLNLFGWFSGNYNLELDSHLIYNLTSTRPDMDEIRRFIENILYPDKKSPSFETLPHADEGNLKDSFFPHVVRSLISKRATGKLILEKKDRKKSVRFEKGIPVSVYSDHPSEKIGKLMTRVGFIDMDDWLRLEDETKFIKEDLVTLAKSEGLIDDKKAKTAKALSYIERFLELFAWRSGIFRFERRTSFKCASCSTIIQIKSELDPNKYACPKCGEAIEQKNFTIQTNTSISKPVIVRGERSAVTNIEKIKSLETKSIKGEIPSEMYCEYCEKMLDPVLKKCSSCAEETLLDNYSFDDKREESLKNKETVGAQEKTHDIPKRPENSQSYSDFDVLSNNLLALCDKNKTKVISLISLSDKAGKTFVTLNCALNLANTFNKKVLIIEGNFKNPSIAPPFGINPEFGMLDVLNGKKGSENVIYETPHENLKILPLKARSKKIKVRNKELLENLFTELIKNFDLLLIDAGNDLNDDFTKSLIDQSDGIIGVARKGYSTHKEIAFRLKTLGDVKPLAVVLNRIDQFFEKSGYLPRSSPFSFAEAPKKL